MKRLFLSVFTCAALVSVAPASAQVIINGVRLNQAEIVQLARYTCGPVFPGNYWINMANGYWGYMGSTRVMGHVKDRCPRGQRGTFRQGHMSQEGRLFYPGELLK